MKLIFESWRRFINENTEIDKSTERLLSMLINLKKFKGSKDFLSRAKLIIYEEGATLNFNLSIDGQLAGMASYAVLEKQDNCRPKPYQNKKTYMLSNIAREGSFKGYGIGRLIGFLSACYVNSIGGSITSDRDTSDKAGKQLVDSLKMVGAKQSEQFDYVGFFIDKLERVFFDSKGQYRNPSLNNMAPTSDKTGKAAITSDFHDDKLRAEFDKSFEKLVRKVIDNLKPITPQVDDDCDPSSNIMVASGVGFARSFYKKEFPAFLEKVATMSSQELQDFLNSDDRVQGFTFVLPSDMINAGKQIIKAIDKTSKMSDEEKESLALSARNMFVLTYDAEIGEHGRAKEEES